MFQNRNWSTKGERNPVRVPQLGGRRGRSKPRDQQLALSTILPRAWAMLLQFQKKSEPLRQEMEELTGPTFSFVNTWKWMHICKLGSVEQYSLFKHLVMYSFNEHWMPIKQQMLFLRPCVCVCVCVCVCLAGDNVKDEKDTDSAPGSWWRHWRDEWTHNCTGKE